MYTEPSDIDVAALARELERHWGLSDPALEYVPVGFGSHHWRAVDHDGGRVLRWLGDRHAVRMEPYVEGETSDSGAYETPEECRRVATALGRLHTSQLPAGLPVRDDLAIPLRASLEQALGNLDVPWNAGPFGERTRSLVRPRADELRRRLLAYDEAADRTRRAPEAWVVTHGEPHRANVIVGARGDIHLVDWDTVLVAPKERDLWMVLDDDRTGWDEYLAEAGPILLRPEVLDLYRDRWDLVEVAIYLTQFRAAHDETTDTQVAWESLNESMMWS